MSLRFRKSRKARSAFVFWLTVIAIVGAAVPAVANPASPNCANLGPSRPFLPAPVIRELPPACYIIFPSEHEAAGYCPIGIKPTKVFDFWQHNFLGWSCDCGPTDAVPPEPGSDEPIDV